VRTWGILRSLPCDIFLGAHGNYFGMDEKLVRFKAGEKPNPSSIRKGIAISSMARNKPISSSYPPKKMQLIRRFAILNTHSRIVAHALVRAASRLVSTLACEFVPHLNKRRDESRRRRPSACATVFSNIRHLRKPGVCIPPHPQAAPAQHRLLRIRLDAIRDKHWETKPAGLDWQAIHDEFRPAIEKADSMDEARAVLSKNA